jgi:hypothetical protein
MRILKRGTGKGTYIFSLAVRLQSKHLTIAD